MNGIVFQPSRLGIAQSGTDPQCYWSLMYPTEDLLSREMNIEGDLESFERIFEQSEVSQPLNL